MCQLTCEEEFLLKLTKMKSKVHEITHEEYVRKLLGASAESKLVWLNCDVPEDKGDIRFFSSEEGISYLKNDGFMGGLCRLKKGDENLTEIHQQHRISLGGFFLDCYEGKLSAMYIANGFNIIARVPFQEYYAKKGWEEFLFNKPDVLLMSLDEKPLRKVTGYNQAYKYASQRNK